MGGLANSPLLQAADRWSARFARLRPAAKILFLQLRKVTPSSWLGGQVVVHIGTGAELEPYRVYGAIRGSEIVRAVRIIETIEEYLLDQWRKHHGD